MESNLNYLADPTIFLLIAIIAAIWGLTRSMEKNHREWREMNELASTNSSKSDAKKKPYDNKKNKFTKNFKRNIKKQPNEFVFVGEGKNGFWVKNDDNEKRKHKHR